MRIAGHTRRRRVSPAIATLKRLFARSASYYCAMLRPGGSMLTSKKLHSWSALVSFWCFFAGKKALGNDKIVERDYESMPENPSGAAAQVSEKRFSVTLSGSAYNDLKEIADSTGRTMTDVVRLGIGLVRTFTNETRLGHRISVSSSSGQVIKDLILP